VETAIAPEVCSSCGNPATADGEFCLFCGDVLARSRKPISEIADSSDNIPLVVTSPESNEYAGFWRRVLAGSIDVVLEVIVALLLSLIVDLVLHAIGGSMGIAPESMAYVTGVTFIVLLTVGGWLYCAISESSRYRATLGKRLLGLQVVTLSGDQLTFPQASVRHVMKFLSLFTVGFGFMMAGWTKRSQALHDMPNECLVIRVPEQTLSIFCR
jgi:uncharacterized RDD family membrane protein YckC